MMWVHGAGFLNPLLGGCLLYGVIKDGLKWSLKYHIKAYSTLTFFIYFMVTGKKKRSAKGN